MSYPVITLKRGKEDSLRRFHPWVFSGAVAQLPDGIEEGDVVEVRGASGDLLGVGHYQIGSIVVRMLEFGRVRAIDHEFFSERLSAAFSLP